MTTFEIPRGTRPGAGGPLPEIGGPVGPSPRTEPSAPGGAFAGLVDLPSSIRDALGAALGGSAAFGPQLTPGAVLAMMQRRLADLDGQVATTMEAIENATRTAEAINGRVQDLRRALEHLEPHFRADGTLWLPTDKAEYDAALTLPDGRHITHILAAAGAEFNEEGQLSGTFTRARMDTLIQRATDDLRTATSGNEMLMIQLQSAMQQRTSAIQLGSNVLKAIDDGMDSVVGNIR
jgi:hypothetical protein